MTDLGYDLELVYIEALLSRGRRSGIHIFPIV